jgi:hypothetical protein
MQNGTNVPLLSAVACQLDTRVPLPPAVACLLDTKQNNTKPPLLPAVAWLLDSRAGEDGGARPLGGHERHTVVARHPRSICGQLRRARLGIQGVGFRTQGVGFGIRSLRFRFQG